jgi:hypothetical protein
MLVNYKVTAVVIFLIGALYYGWPIIEALILVLPIPDPKDSLEKMKSIATSATGAVAGVMTSKRGSG